MQVSKFEIIFLIMGTEEHKSLGFLCFLRFSGHVKSSREEGTARTPYQAAHIVPSSRDSGRQGDKPLLYIILFFFSSSDGTPSERLCTVCREPVPSLRRQSRIQNGDKSLWPVRFHLIPIPRFPYSPEAFQWLLS